MGFTTPKEELENYAKYRSETDPTVEEVKQQMQQSPGSTILKAIGEPGSFKRMRDTEVAVKAAQQEAKDAKKREAESEKKREGRGMKKGGKVSSASKRADGIATKGKTRGRII